MATCQICGAWLPVGAMFCGECGSSRTATVESRKRPDPRPNDTTIIARLPRAPVVISVPIPAQVPAPVRAIAVVTAAPPALPAAVMPTRATFVLTFSTGQRVTVQGSGLIGRKPLAQPDEIFDELIRVADADRSLSKTHLEFGQHDGEFWVSDRVSGNGTVIRRPGETAEALEPGRRYVLPRGTRVEIADNSFNID
ncbi:FHA domain-containing protein [Cryobacterium sp. PH31-L1]|uniref:FHA domain-containing protein n=1 Tax=Cryobacterium sp. PH31-L1 TaxID=3046199 RepID=UPI0024BB59C8|nr:FHA domain-containing protein [Cryobacterium sp. PH31-L1]MDJ0376544.1 FHA domain-containing protein [Cryobacterium sp. PH31-L1]